MKLKYKKLIIVISIGALLLSFLILTLIPTGGDSSNQVEDAPLEKCEDEEILNLVTNYFQAKRDVDMEMMESLVSAVNQVNQENLIRQAEYVEDYLNFECYSLENEDNGALRLYVRYDMKMKNIDTLGPCLSGLYITVGSDGNKLIYLSALDVNEEEFILSADKNSHVEELQKEVAAAFQAAIDSDESFRQLYQKMDQGIVAAENNQNANAADPNAAADPNTAADPNAAVDPNAGVDPNAAADPNAGVDPNTAPAQ